MLAGLTPAVVNELLKSVGGYADTNLVIWNKIQSAMPNLEFEWRGWEYDNDKVKEAIDKYEACLVEVDFDGKINTPKDKHWVVYIGNGRMIDPWTGVEKSTGWYSIATGFAVIKIRKQNGNGEAQKIIDRLREERDKNWNLYQAEQTKNTELSEEVGQLKKEKEECQNQGQDRLVKLAEKLDCPPEFPAIMGKVEGLLTVEEQNRILTEKDKEKREIIERLNDTIEEREKEIKGYKEQLAEIEKKYNKLTEEFSKQRQEVMKLQDENKKLKEASSTPIAKPSEKSLVERLVAWISTIFNKLPW